MSVLFLWGTLIQIIIIMPDSTDNNNAHEIAVRDNELRYGKFLALFLAPDESMCHFKLYG